MSSLNSQMTMVVARYNENLDWLKTIPCKFIVFNKGRNNLSKWIKNQVKLPNIGREAHTYLTFIVDNYDNLPDYTIFVQGNPFIHQRELLKNIEEFKGGVDFFPLTKIYKGGRHGLSRTERRIAELARKIFVPEIKNFHFPNGAQFIVSKNGLLFHTKLTYQKILGLMAERIAPNEICSFTRHGRRGCGVSCEGRRLFSAFVMERLWKVLFEHKTIYD